MFDLVWNLRYPMVSSNFLLTHAGADPSYTSSDWQGGLVMAGGDGVSI